MKLVKFVAHYENEWIDHKANLKCLKPIQNYELSQTTSWMVVYVWLGAKNLYPESYIKSSKN